MEEKDIVSEVTEETVVSEDKESTQELRESYEEVAADSAPDKKKKKKKRSKKKIALIVVASFILAIGLAVGLFFLIGTLLAEDYNPVEVEFNNKMPEKPLSFSAAEQTLISNVLSSANPTEDQIKETIAAMYYRANYNKIHAEQAIAVLRGEGSAAIEFMGKHPSGTMIVRGIKVQSGNEFYYQKAAKVVECSIPAIQSFLKNTLNQQERTYTNMNNAYLLTRTLKGKNAKILDTPETKTVPFLSVGIPGAINSYSDQAIFFRDGYYLEDPREITNFNIQKDYIVLKELEEGQKYVEYDAEKKIYTLRFSLLLEPGEAHEDCVRVARQYLRDSTNSTDLDYTRFDVVLEIWENGYLKSMHDDEGWKGNLDGTETESRSDYNSIMYYDFSPELFSEEDLALYTDSITTGEDGKKQYVATQWAGKIIERYYNEISGVKKKKITE